MQIETINPKREPAWEEFVHSSPEATVFHTTAWANVLNETYGFSPRYLIARNGAAEIIAGVPFVETRGRRLVSLPFSDNCAPLLPSGAAAEAFIAAVKDVVVSSGAKSVELRGGSKHVELVSQGFQESSAFVQHVVPLTGSLEEIEARCHPSVRRGVRRAERSGVTVRRSTSEEDMRRFFLLQTLTRKKLGLLPQPWRFFETIHRHFLQKGAGYVLLAEHEGSVIGGDVLLLFRGTLVDKFSASDPRFLNLRPNNLLHRSAIELGLALGCDSLDLGRSDIDAEGLRRFKSNWGAAERPMPYYHYPSLPAASAVATATSLPRRVLAFGVRFAPLWALRRAGAVLYRYAA